MSDETKLMGVPFGRMKMDDERTGISPAKAAIWQATHPEVKYADIPTSQEVEDGESGESGESGDIDDDSTAENVIPPGSLTEEQRLKRLLSSFAKSIWEYFCAKK